MGKNIFIPFKGASNILFGLKRSVIRNCIKDPYIEFKRNEFAENSTDHYEKRGLFLEYDSQNICEAMEFSSSSNLFFNDRDFMLMSYSELRSIFDKQSTNSEEEENVSVTYHDLGFSVKKYYGSDIIETILIFSKDYWQQKNI